MSVLLRGVVRRTVVAHEPLTTMQAEIQSLRKIQDLIAVANEQHGNFTKMDWLALLAALSRCDRSTHERELAELYLQLSRAATTLWGSRGSFGTLLHRLGVLQASVAIFELLPLVKPHIAHMSWRDCAILAWAMQQSHVQDSKCWGEIEGRVISMNAS